MTVRRHLGQHVVQDRHLVRSTATDTLSRAAMAARSSAWRTAPVDDIDLARGRLDVVTADPIPAGDFGSWLDRTLAAIDGTVDADVPCGGCTACCTSAQFVHIGPDETDALAHIPAELLFPAPLRPKGHVLLGFDEHGRCPMLADGGCSIYAHRPRTCRTYDCRVFPASDLVPAEETKVAIAERAGRWHFTHADDVDRARHDAVRAAAAWLGAHPDLVGEHAPTTTLLAVLAVEVHGAFLTVDELGAAHLVEDPAPEVVRDALIALARGGTSD